jgi:hypothetical protein
MKKKETSEFGKGFIYNLVLFAKHWGNLRSDFIRPFEKIKSTEGRAISIWMNGASDHFFELKIPEKWRRRKIGKLAKWLKETALDYGHGVRMMDEVSKKEFDEIFSKLEELCILIDKELGVDAIEATWN